MAGNFYGGEFFGGGFFGTITPPTPTPSTSGGGGGTIDWQQQRGRKRRNRNQELFDALAQTLRELVAGPVETTQPAVAVATEQAARDTLQRLDALATTQALQREVAALRHAVADYLRRQEQLLADDDETFLMLM
jgi:hypothetical protein